MPSPPPSPRLAARRRRFSRIRRWTAATASAVFIALFGTIYVRVAKEDAAAATASAQTSVRSAGNASSSSSGSSSSSLAPMTTSQS